ncbi:MAG TPA: response regulator [Gammaproteobacteria bacterium]|nr:response regulator [Gammaproteobacteria bacterium]
MKLRSQISLILLLLGLTPLLVALAINLPLVFEKLESFYHEAYLEKLRTDFHDLDQHITRRQEMVRLFAKLPEPGIALEPDSEDSSGNRFMRTRAAYTEWANRVLFDQLDIIQVIFINRNGEVSFSLDRDRKTGLLKSDNHVTDLPSTEFLTAGLKLAPGAVLTSPISFNRQRDSADPSRFMTLSFISPLITTSEEDGSPELQGVVVFNLDVGGLAQIYNGIYWVQNNGEYLSDRQDMTPTSTAFRDFPGLEQLFAKGELALWELGGQQMFWLPLFITQDTGPLWVGRSVDPSPLTEFVKTLELRVISIVTVLVLVIVVVARAIALRMERISHELTEGITEVLEQEHSVNFSWQRPEELRKLGENLTRLAQCHAQDAQALREHARELEASNRYKSEFLANVSHELRTPLNSILLLSKLLADKADALPPDQLQQARVIHAAGRDLRTLIDTILDLSRIEAGKTRLNTETLDLPALLGDVTEIMRPQFEEKGLQLELVIDNKAPATLVSDGEKLRQIIVNFLSNALKFTEQGKVTLQLSRNSGDQADSHPLAVSVHDSGIGIPAEKQALVFEAFNQVDGSTSRRYGGTGLGLTISRELATLIDARIEVKSDTGSGSTFTLLLPPVLDADTAHEHKLPAIPHGEARPDNEQDTALPDAHYPGKRVLLVDDDIRNLLALSPLLERWDISVLAAGSGAEALESLLHDDEHFDLVLLDLMMPDMDGCETLRRIRAETALQHLPVVVLTARAAAEDRDMALAAGADDYLSKPVEALDLKRVLDHYLGMADTNDLSQEPS